MTQRQVTVQWTFSFVYMESELSTTQGASAEELTITATQISKNELEYGIAKQKARVICEVTE